MRSVIKINKCLFGKEKKGRHITQRYKLSVILLRTTMWIYKDENFDENQFVDPIGCSNFSRGGRYVDIISLLKDNNYKLNIINWKHSITKVMVYREYENILVSIYGKLRNTGFSRPLEG